MWKRAPAEPSGDLAAPPPEAASSADPALTQKIRDSGLFDATFYDAQLRALNLDRRELSPLDHYVQHGDRRRIAPNPLFDPRYYAESNPDVAAARINTLAHFIEHGAREGRNPHPLFDLKLVGEQLGADFEGNPLAAYLQSSGPDLRPHRLVDPAFIIAAQRRLAPSDTRPPLVFYLSQDPDILNPSPDFDGFGYRQMYPETKAWPPLYHYAWRGEAEGRRAMKDRASLGRVAPQIEAAGSLDPDIVKPFADIARTVVMAGYDLARREFRLYNLLTRAAGSGPYAHVFVVPWLKFGGAERAAIHLARALLEADPSERVLFVCTQSDEIEALTWAPVTRRLVVVKIAKEVDDANDTYMAFANFLRFAGCRHLYLVNSRFGWSLIEKYGHVLKSLLAAYGFAFCHDYDDAGRKAGYAWTHLRTCLPHLAALVSDNSRIWPQLAADHRFDARDRAKFFCLYLPVDPTLAGRVGPQVAHHLAQGPRRRHKALWAGRFGAQKGLDAVLAIARALPELDFRLYGGEAEQLPEMPPANLSAGGGFSEFADLPLHEATLFLHTSRWDGLPNVLLEAGAAGLPIVAADVGGVADLVDETTGWLVAPDSGPEVYAAAIRALLADPQATLARRDWMSARIAARHAPATFAAEVARLGAFAEQNRAEMGASPA